MVLIVAKCNVNEIWEFCLESDLRVLIVAKCNVNKVERKIKMREKDSINSSKV